MAGRGSRRSGALVLAAMLAPACYSFHTPGPEDPSPVELPRTVSVTVQYRQPNGCINADRSRCEEPVAFFATWMRPGGEFRLTPDPGGSHVWTGTAYSVPVNFPPRDNAYEVRIVDPYLQETPGAVRYTAQRLIVGGETVEHIEHPSNFDEFGLIYIDDNGQGRNPF